MNESTTDEYHVYAILHQTHERGIGWQEPCTTAVSAESEYGAIKRFAACHTSRIIDIELIPGRKPEYAERRVEGYTRFDWKACRKDDGEGNPHHDWQYR